MRYPNYAVVEDAGMPDERPVFETQSFAYAWVHINEHYPEDERQELGVDVMVYDENGNLTTEW